MEEEAVQDWKRRSWSPWAQAQMGRVSLRTMVPGSVHCLHLKYRGYDVMDSITQNAKTLNSHFT